MPLHAGDLLPGTSARDARAPGLAVALRALAGDGPLLLLVYRGDCGASPLAAAVLPRFAAVPGLALAALAQDGSAEALAFAAAHRWGSAVRVLLDEPPWPASEALGVLVTPTWLLVERGGRIAAVSDGWSRDAANGLAARAAALAGAPAPVVSSPADAGPAFRPG